MTNAICCLKLSTARDFEGQDHQILCAQIDL